MSFVQNHLKPIAIIGVVVIAAGVTITIMVLNSNDELKVTLLYNAGVMIEKDNTRIYIDPFDLPSDYSNYPADIILITHNHSDHYDPVTIDLIITEDTNLFFPAIMHSEALQYGANSVQPEYTFEFNNFNVSCFYMYTFLESHPKSCNYTSYIIEFEGFTLFHAGDSWNIEEYEQLTDEIDLAFLPLGPGCQTMEGIEVVYVIETIKPSYFIPIHYTDASKDIFIEVYKDSVEECGCQLIDLEYYESYSF
jgi:L-ascorbate metabolism protein UlaG (beta-lactamase superfamily)